MLSRNPVEFMAPRNIVTGYFLLQAIGVVAWWVLLVACPQAVHWFQPKAWPQGALFAYWLADLVLIVFGSSIAAVGVWWEKPWASMAVVIVAVVCWYPTLVCIAISVSTGEAWIASAMMVSMAGVSLSMATIQGKAGDVPATFRATSMSRSTSLLSTLLQIVIFWGVFLWVLPLAIVEAQGYLGWNAFHHDFQESLAVSLFLFASALGLWSGLSMAIRGGGTPLPTATAPRLVVSGPYRYVRNPMAVAGILQGIAVGWFLGSIPVIAYAMTGILVWHFCVRPAEERDLLARFGESYQSYRKQVGVWLPKLTSGRSRGE